MGKRKGPAAARTAKPGTAQEISYRFDGFAVVRVQFQEVGVPATLERPPRVNIGLQTNITVGITRDLKADVRMAIQAVPDPRYQPYHILIEILGRFSTLEPGTADDLLRFSQRSAPTILFPYLREAVQRVSADGRFGPVRIDPINFKLAAENAPQGWRTIDPQAPDLRPDNTPPWKENPTDEQDT